MLRESVTFVTPHDEETDRVPVLESGRDLRAGCFIGPGDSFNNWVGLVLLEDCRNRKHFNMQAIIQ